MSTFRFTAFLCSITALVSFTGCEAMKSSFNAGKRPASTSSSTSTASTSSSSIWDPNLTFAWNDGLSYSMTNMSPTINKTLPTSDGGYLISGWFNAIGRKRISTGTMLLDDTSGSINSSFNSGGGTGFSGVFNNLVVYYGGVYDIETDPTDTTYHYYAGAFTSHNGSTANKVARIGPDGRRDSNFNPGTFRYLTSTNAYVSAVVPLGSSTPALAGKVLVFGLFDEIGGIATPNCVALLDSTGAVDLANFSPAMGGFVDGAGSGLAFTEAKQFTDGTIYVVGMFTSYNGVNSWSIVQIDLAAGGSVPAAWQAGYLGYDTLQGQPPMLHDLEISSSSKFFIVGTMTDYNGTAIGRVSCLGPNGAAVAAFHANVSAGFDADVYSVSINPAETKIAVSGGFSFFGVTYSPAVSVLNFNGTIDAGFSSSGAYFATTAVAVSNVQYDSSGNLFVAGEFDSWGSDYVHDIVKLSPTGSIVTAFDTGGGVNGVGNSVNVFYTTRAVLVTPANSISKLHYDSTGLRVGGTFSYYGGIAANGYAKLASDGTPVSKTSFNTLAVSSQYGTDLALIPNGSGEFYNLTTDGTGFYYIYRHMPDGSLHATYPAGLVLNTTGVAIAADSSEQLYVAGAFSTISGNGTPTGFSRLTAAGTVDAAFNAGFGTGFDNVVYAVTVDDDVVYIGGAFTTLNGAAMPGNIQYLYAADTATGLVSTRISTAGLGPDSDVHAIEVTDTSVYIGGAFNNYNGTPAIFLAKISKTDGTLDAAFDTSVNFADDTVRGIDIGLNGELLVAGDFTTYDGAISRFAAIVDPDTGNVDPTFTTSVTGSTVRGGRGLIPHQSGGGYLFYGLFTTTNGTLKRALSGLTTTGANIQ